MWKYTKVCVNPHRRKCAFPHVEIHMRSCISACGNTPKIVTFPTCGNTHFWCISTCGNSSGKVNFRMSIYKRIREFPRGKTCGNTRFFGDFHMRKYTRKCEFPRAEIHAERCITACGNTLNQVQKIVLNRHGVKSHVGVNNLWFKFLEKRISVSTYFEVFSNLILQ